MSDGFLSFDARRLRVDLERFDAAAPDARAQVLALIGRYLDLIRRDRASLAWRRSGAEIAITYAGVDLLAEAVAALGLAFVEPQRVSRDAPPLAELEARLAALR